VYAALVPGSSYLMWNPILKPTEGTDFWTKSFFVNDRWRLGKHFSFNLGVRYDKNDGTDQEGKKVIKLRRGGHHQLAQPQRGRQPALRHQPRLQEPAYHHHLLVHRPGRLPHSRHHLHGPGAELLLLRGGVRLQAGVLRAARGAQRLQPQRCHRRGYHRVHQGHHLGFPTFNPFTETPQECPQGQSNCAGYHWQKGPNFGKPTTAGSYQTPRTFLVSLGVRF